MGSGDGTLNYKEFSYAVSSEKRFGDEHESELVSKRNNRPKHENDEAEMYAELDHDLWIVSHAFLLLTHRGRGRSGRAFAGRR